MEILSEINDKLKTFNARIAHVHTETFLEPELGPSINEMDIDYKLKKTITEYGIERLYKYQYEAYRKIKNKENIMIISGTGTGKTEAFLIPILDLALRGERSVLIYPTKALARDQLTRVYKLAGELELNIGIFDGDTPEKERERLYRNPPHILITNPDMIHLGLALSNRFRFLLRTADHFIFDEVHVYEGVLGAHIRNLADRIKEFKNDIHIVASSATIGATKYLFGELFGVEGEIIEGTRRRKGIALHGLIDSGNSSRWTLAAYLAAVLVKKGLKVLVFTDSQQMTELVAKIADRFRVNLEVHRAGLNAEERIKVEEKLRNGELDGVVATPTLELGIDIGSIDAVIMAENPPSYTKYIQRAGRAGRRNNAGLIFTILGDDPIDSYYLRHPEEFFNRKIQPLTFDPTNMEVIKIHALAYLAEKYRIRLDNLPPLWKKAYEILNIEGKAKIIGSNVLAVSETKKYLASTSLRSVGPIVRIYEDKKKIGERELPAALHDLYPNAVYLISKKTYIIEELDIDRLIAKARKVNSELSYYTKPLYSMDLLEFNKKDEREVYGEKVEYGEMKLLMRVEGYVTYDVYSKGKGGRNEYFYENPISFTYDTKGLLIYHPLIDDFTLIDHMEAYHATEHVLISAARVAAGASLTDLGGISYPSGHVVIYDSSIGGSGVAKLLFERLDQAYEVALDIVKNCNCEDGCPNCVYSPYCGNNNKYLSRKKSLRLIDGLIRGSIKGGSKDREGSPIA
ncbi:DEAD/DEAH box helicase [Saccharolobus shibatae]|uniref:ATP-dependent helicase n=1 Tax=Saccharolobus shibatae TaxID=2286 RepID=A0A8F5BSR6_9CREN|nr:DEAD/DEAH box helicase [Saccharolobus shibatae]QXJ30670.1 ATP-dependent helicase [Saccharolobus shibatae]